MALDIESQKEIVKYRIEKAEKNALDKALDEVRYGKMLHYNSLDELIKDI